MLGVLEVALAAKCQACAAPGSRESQTQLRLAPFHELVCELSSVDASAEVPN